MKKGRPSLLRRAAVQRVASARSMSALACMLGVTVIAFMATTPYAATARATAMSTTANSRSGYRFATRATSASRCASVFAEPAVTHKLMGVRRVLT